MRKCICWADATAMISFWGDVYKRQVHFKWFKQFRVLQFRWRLLVDAWLQMFVLFTVNNAENAAVVFDIILERMGIFLCHPST